MLGGFVPSVRENIQRRRLLPMGAGSRVAAVAGGPPFPLFNVGHVVVFRFQQHPGVVLATVRLCLRSGGRLHPILSAHRCSRHFSSRVSSIVLVVTRTTSRLHLTCAGYSFNHSLPCTCFSFLFIEFIFSLLK